MTSAILSRPTFVNFAEAIGISIGTSYVNFAEVTSAILSRSTLVNFAEVTSAISIGSTFGVEAEFKLKISATYCCWPCRLACEALWQSGSSPQTENLI